LGSVQWYFIGHGIEVFVIRSRSISQKYKIGARH